MKLLFPHDPRKKMDEYLFLTDWSLLEQVRSWKKSRHAGERRLGEEWGRIVGRDIKWKMAYSTVLKEKGQEAVRQRQDASLQLGMVRNRGASFVSPDMDGRRRVGEPGPELNGPGLGRAEQSR